MRVACKIASTHFLLVKNHFPTPPFFVFVPQTPGGARPRSLGWPLDISASLRFRSHKRQLETIFLLRRNMHLAVGHEFRPPHPHPQFLPHTIRRDSQPSGAGRLPPADASPDYLCRRAFSARACGGRPVARLCALCPQADSAELTFGQLRFPSRGQAAQVRRRAGRHGDRHSGGARRVRRAIAALHESCPEEQEGAPQAAQPARGGGVCGRPACGAGARGAAAGGQCARPRDQGGARMEAHARWRSRHLWHEA